ncbi:MAG: hypothetical protein ACFHWX_18345 [Bacteroidota bacterium]
MQASSEIKIYEILKTKFTKKESEELVSNFKSLQEEGLYEKIDSRVSQAESSLIKWVFGVAAGQLILLITIIKLFLV